MTEREFGILWETAKNADLAIADIMYGTLERLPNKVQPFVDVEAYWNSEEYKEDRMRLKSRVMEWLNGMSSCG